MSGDGAFVRAFRAELDAAAHAALVDLYVWVVGDRYGVRTDVAFLERAERWAADVEARGLTFAVLEATAG